MTVNVMLVNTTVFMFCQFISENSSCVVCCSMWDTQFSDDWSAHSDDACKTQCLWTIFNSFLVEVWKHLLV